MRQAGRRSARRRVVLAAIGRRSSRSRPAQTPAPQSSQPTFRVNVDLVTLDVIPRTANGQFVPNLGKADFQVLEDGVAQTGDVARDGARRPRVQRARRRRPARPRRRKASSCRGPKPAADTAGRIFVLLVDDLHFTATETPLVRALLKKVVGQLFHQGDMLAMFSTGPSSIEIPVSYDKRLLEEAISRVGGHGMSYRDIMDSLDGAQGPQGLRYNAHVAFKTAFELIGNLERMGNRRKVLLLVSNGYDFDPFPGGRTGTDQVFGGRYGTPYRRCGARRPLPGHGGAAQHVRRQRPGRPSSPRSRAPPTASTPPSTRSIRAAWSAPRTSSRTSTSRELRTHISKTQSSLRVLADATGGFAVVNDNRYDSALARIDAETSDYYILGYSPSNPDPKHRNRQVEVKTTRPGVQVASRGWYRTRDRRRAATQALSGRAAAIPCSRSPTRRCPVAPAAVS